MSSTPPVTSCSSRSQIVFRRCLRATDTAAQLGGDEFAVLIEDVAVEHDAEVVAQQLLDVLQEPFTIARRELYVRASIGIAHGRSSGAQ